MPRFAVGIIIGRNGEMIKKIQNDAGVRIQFKQGKKIKQDLMLEMCNLYFYSCVLRGYGVADVLKCN